MKFYKSTAGCGYGEFAIVTPISKSTKDYLCIWTNECSTIPVHVEGQIVEDLDDIYLEETEIDINDYPISKSFLFKSFMNSYHNEHITSIVDIISDDDKMKEFLQNKSLLYTSYSVKDKQGQFQSVIDMESVICLLRLLFEK